MFLHAFTEAWKYTRVSTGPRAILGGQFVDKENGEWWVSQISGQGVHKDRY